MPAAHDAPPWTIRSTLIAVADLDRSVAFYQELGPFEEIAREDAVALLGAVSPPAVLLMLRESRSTHHIRHGQQSVGLRSISFNVGSQAELDRVESVLRDQDLFTSRQEIADGAAELVYGRDPDNLPLVFVHYVAQLGPDYYRAIAHMVYSLDS
jgi:catechol 2,3-dioxygenase-like lactoylglutathione lyase family enzyme